MTQNSPNPITFEIIWHRLMQLTEEMGLTYFRTSGSHVLITGTDASTAVMLDDGSLVSVGPYIVTQSNVLSLMVQTTLETCSENPGIHEGDTFICNDPYSGAIHQPDVATLSPVFDGDELVAWVGASGHQLDNGGMDPGGFSIHAVEIHQEGLRMPPVKIVEQGRFREDILRWIGNQVRDELVPLDVRAQIAANNVGRKRLKSLLRRYGVDTVRMVMEEAISYAEERLRERLNELPDGTWREVQYIDHDGHSPNIYKIVCTLIKEGDHLTFDFSGTSQQARGLINSTWSGLMAGVLSATYILLAYDMPWNSGILNCISIDSPGGTVNDCDYPAPCAMATISAVIVTIDAVWGTLAKMLSASDEYRDEAMANWTGSSMAPIFSGVSQHGYDFAHTEMSHFGGGGGARSYKDGVDTAGIVFNTTPNIPNIEIIEQDFPILYLFRRHLTDSGGPGKYRGGLSGELAYIVHDAPEGELEGLFAGTGAEQPNALGLSGGMPGAAIRVLRLRETDIPQRLAAGGKSSAGRGGDAPARREQHASGERALPAWLAAIEGKLEILPPKHPRSPFLEGDVWYHNWQGAGGYGDPLDRDPKLVSQDVRNHAVSLEVARRVYGVELDPDTFDVDESSTREQREAIRAERVSHARSRVHHGDPPESRFQVGEYLWVDPETGGVWCRVCNAVLADGDQDWKANAAAEVAPVTHAGPVRGEDYDRGRVNLILYYCPGCGTQLDVIVAHEGAPRPFFRLHPS